MEALVLDPSSESSQADEVHAEVIAVFADELVGV
jgi:hypothetical protein